MARMLMDSMALLVDSEMVFPGRLRMLAWKAIGGLCLDRVSGDLEMADR